MGKTLLKIPLLLLWGLLMLPLSVFSQKTYSLSTSPPHTNSTSTSSGSGMTFNLKARTAPLKITNLTCGFAGTSGGYEIWYKKDSINGVPLLTAANNWILHETGTWTGSGIIDLKMKKEIKIPAGKTYGFVIVNTTGSAQYSSTTTPNTFRDPNLQLYMGPSVAYVVYGTPVGTSNIANRFYCGTVYYEFDYSSPNDAGITRLVSPKNFCTGTQNVEIEIQNFGSKQLTSVQVNWSLNGTLQTPISYTSTLDTLNGKGKTNDIVKLTSLTFTSTTKHTIKAWTSSPNTVKDTVNLNDTIVAELAPALQGTYTINPSGTGTSNFKTFGEAVSLISKHGICGPVVFNVSAGTYKERIVIPSISGSSATNTITFDGTGASSKPVITNAAVATTDMNAITLDGADYVTFKGFTIENTGATYGVGVMLSGGADYNKILNNNIILPANTTSAYHIGIVSSADRSSYSTYGNTANYNLIEGNTITSGYYGIRFNGSSTTSVIAGNRFINNKITDYYYYGMYLYYLGGHDVIGNTITARTSGTTTTGSYGILNYYAIDYNISENDITAYGYGIYNYYGHNYLPGTKQSLISNNFVRTVNTYGLYNPYSNKVNIYHNTFLQTAGTYGVYLLGSSGVDFQNNIIDYRGSAGYPIYIGTGSTFTGLDYNNYYSTSGTIVNNNGTLYKTLADWQAAVPAFNKNSIEKQPDFVSLSDLHLNPNSGQPFGKYLGIDKDIDGQTRCVMAPTIGADESTVGKTARPSANFSGSDTLFVGAPATYFNTGGVNDPYFYQWYVNGVFVEDSAHLNVTPPSTGTFTIKMVITGCAGKDSLTRTIRVVNPVAKPAVRFLSDKSIIVQGEVVRFSDLSKNGASAWKWEITPDSTFDGADKIARYKFLYNTNASSQNPVVQFNSSGRYRVCLTASNSLGANTLCRTDYIIVEAGYSLLSGTQKLLDSSAYLFDNGGRNGAYTNSFKGSFLLAPCAEEIYLIVRKFDLECGFDYLRVFDGADNTGTPLHCTTNISGANGPGFTGGSNSCASSCVPSLTDTFVAKSGKMFIEMTTDAGNAGAGFEAYYWAKPKAQPKPTASFSSPDSVCINQALNFINTSTGDDMTFFWDLDNDLTTFEATTKDAIWPYYLTGSYNITLLAQNCGGIDTFTKEIIAYAPPTPNISFVADNTNPTTNDVVFMSSTIKECVEDFRWKFTSVTGKQSVVFVNGTTARSENPQVMFLENGCYTVQLLASNTNGADSLKLNCYITVKNPYCVPTVANNVNDLGISKVTLNTLSSASTQGTEDYQNFTPSRSTTLELGVTYTLTVERSTAQNEISRTAWIDWNADGDFNDAGEKVAEELNKSTRIWSVSIKVPTSAKIGATVMRVASNDGSFGNKVCGQNEYGEYEDYRIYVAPYLTLPVITLTGTDTMYLEQGVVYTEPGYKATSRLYGDITADVKVKEPISGFYTIPGTYTFTYTVEDAASNNAIPVTRVVIVVPDTTAPKLIIAGADSIEVQVGTAFKVPAIVSADDLVDGDLRGAVVTSNGVNANVVGEYTITYTVSDRSGNTATVTKYVHVIDTVMPTLVIVGANPTIHEVGTAYNDSGVTVGDNFYTEAQLRNNLTTTSNVNENVLGSYTVVYTLTDPFTGRQVSATRVVEVRDRTAPVVTLVGDTAITLDVNTTLVDPGVTAQDNYDQNVTITRGGNFYTAFPSGRATTLGAYKVEYTVTDASGNKTVISRTINVVDRVAPVITLNGDPSVNVCRWSTYTDAGYSVSDNFYGSSDITVTQEGDFTSAGTDLEGIYNLRYKAVDKSGNISYSEYRRINVRNPHEFPCSTATGISADVTLDKLINIYPNPNTGKFTVEANLPATEQVRITVVNLLGQEVAVISNGAMNVNTFQVDLSNQKAGVYMLNIVTSKQSVTKRIVITK